MKTPSGARGDAASSALNAYVTSAGLSVRECSRYPSGISQRCEVSEIRQFVLFLAFLERFLASVEDFHYVFSNTYPVKFKLCLTVLF